MANIISWTIFHKWSYLRWIKILQICKILKHSEDVDDSAEIEKIRFELIGGSIWELYDKAQ